MGLRALLRRHDALFALAAAALLGGCSATRTARAAPDFDRPVPPETPRAEVRLTVDLEPAQDCEERFDLALYENRAVDLIAWDDGVGSCVNRTVTIRYLRERIDRQALIDRVGDLARRVTPATGNGSPASNEDANKEGNDDAS